MPRPSLLTPARSKAILEMLADGVFVETACQAAGVNQTTYHRWLKKADDPDADPTYAAFRDAANVARATAEVNAIRIVVGHAKDDWRAAAWYLERSFPTRYGKLTKLEHTGADGGPITLAGLEALMGLDAHEDEVTAAY